MSSADSRWPTRFLKGVLHGVSVATVFSAYVVLNAGLGGQAHIELGVPVPKIVAGYFLAGITGGLIYGALAPLTKWWPGRVCVGFTIMFPIGVGVMVMLPGAGLDDPGAWIDATVFAVILGGLGGLHFLEPREPDVP